ncbi:SWIM zinc finger family protein [Roseibacillus ishigakijimensis]|uniref:SWIM zinc finger family protein n=1 Tax=Roseibacillus ishigakijimensis TaxID=454146 RepID=A0A934RQC1_9BACT|nr:SWIM zinc finger family protein [Roseibacillus ishigakijimensis]MBK1833518.1 SWIM zinc finger family protein [Roseibacillus ishigakijimensis]
MVLVLTADQVTALAPDAASFKAGRGLAAATKWTDLGTDQSVLWGLAKGSGKNPYQTQVVLGEFATKCSCPSRKFPCKHALGLLFLAAEKPEILKTSEPPKWVAEWLEGRKERAEKSAARAAKKRTAKPKDEAAATKRVEKKAARIDDGIELLDQFLLDRVRNGLTQDQVTQYQTWEELARRLIDSQATGLAGHVRRLGEIPSSSPDWESRLLHELGSLHLLLQTYRKRDTLEPALASEVSQLVGWTPDKEELLKQTGVTDQWFVASRSLTENERLLTSSTWLYGIASKKWALKLTFSALPGRPVEHWPLGNAVETELLFYPGLAADRILPRLETAPSQPCGIPEPPDTVSSLLQRASSTLALNPWRTRIPFLMQAQPSSDLRTLIDRNGDALPWHAREKDGELLLSLCGGRPTALAGEWNGHHCIVHSAADGNSWFSLSPIPQ